MTSRTFAAAVVLAATAVLAGCAAGHAAALPDAVPTVEASGGASSGRDCGRVLSAAELDRLIGSAPEAQASIPVGHPDGLVCSWQGSSRSLTVTAIPKRDAAPADVARLTLPECDPATGFCGGGIEAGGVWMVVDFGWIEGEWEPIVTTALNAVARAAEVHG